MGSGSLGPGKKWKFHAFLGHHFMGVQPKFCRIPSRCWVENTSLAPVINSNATRVRTPSFLPQKEISLGFIQDAKGHLTAMIRFRFCHHPKDTLSAHLRAATSLPPVDHLPQKEPTVPKLQTTLAQALKLECSSWSPNALPRVALFSATWGGLSTFLV